MCSVSSWCALHSFSQIWMKLIVVKAVCVRFWKITIAFSVKNYLLANQCVSDPPQICASPPRPKSKCMRAAKFQREFRLATPKWRAFLQKLHLNLCRICSVKVKDWTTVYNNIVFIMSDEGNVLRVIVSDPPHSCTCPPHPLNKRELKQRRRQRRQRERQKSSRLDEQTTTTTIFIVVWRWLPHRLSKRQSLLTTTVLFRTTFARTIKLNLLLKWLLSSNLSQLYITVYIFS